LTQCWLHWGHLIFICSNLRIKCNSRETTLESSKEEPAEYIFISLYVLSEPTKYFLEIEFRWVIVVGRRRFYFIPFTKTHAPIPTTENYLQEWNSTLVHYYSFILFWHSNTLWVWTIFYQYLYFTAIVIAVKITSIVGSWVTALVIVIVQFLPNWYHASNNKLSESKIHVTTFNRITTSTVTILFLFVFKPKTHVYLSLALIFARISIYIFNFRW